MQERAYRFLPMSHNLMQLQEGAIFISDAHYSFKHKDLERFLKALRSQEIQTPQLILMGDMFDLLFGGVAETLKRNEKVIELINTLSDNVEILYLEGNHDFNLEEIFSGVKVYPLSQQPLHCSYRTKKVSIAHGDFDGPLGYRIYSSLIRNRWVLATLSLLNRVGGGFIIKALDSKLAKKEDCRKIEDFEAYVTRHLSNTTLDGVAMFIEGHHHQDRSFKVGGCEYINLPAFACGATYMQLEAGLLHPKKLESVQ